VKLILFEKSRVELEFVFQSLRQESGNTLETPPRFSPLVVCVCVSLFYVIDTGSMCLLFVNNFNIRFTRRLGIRYLWAFWN
jgi:hypothetical protein